MGLACDPLDRKVRHDGWGPRGDQSDSRRERPSSWMLILSAAAGRACQGRLCELSDHFSLCELFFSFRGLGENIASFVEIKNTARKIRRAGVCR